MAIGNPIQDALCSSVILTSKEAHRFWSKVSKSSECWNWSAYRGKTGYGVIGFRGKVVRAHRLSFTVHKSGIPQGMCVLHTCDNPACVNPAHLWLGTQTENCEDKCAKGRNVSVSGDAHYSRIHPEKLARGNNHHSKTKPESVLRGERHPLAILTQSKVAQIRDLEFSGTPRKRLAAQFGVTKSTIAAIVARRIWKTV